MGSIQSFVNDSHESARELYRPFTITIHQETLAPMRSKALQAANRLALPLCLRCKRLADAKSFTL
jgi:hypothetical protein